MGPSLRPDIILLNISSIHLINNTVHMLPGTTMTLTSTEKPDNAKLVRVKPRISERMERAQKGINTNVFQTEYDPMTGIRTGCILGGFLVLIVVYVIYKGRCKDEDDLTLPEEPWVTEYKQRYDEYMKKIEERTSEKKDEKNCKKTLRKEKPTVVVVPPSQPQTELQVKSASLEKTKKWLRDQPFDLEKLECTECKIHARINQFQLVPSPSLSFEDLHLCGTNREDSDSDFKTPSKGGYLAMNNISLLRKMPSNLEGIDFCNLLHKDFVQEEDSTFVRIPPELQAAEDEMQTTVDIEMTDFPHDAGNRGYIGLSTDNDNDIVMPSVLTSSASRIEELADQEADDSMPLLHQTNSPAKYTSEGSLQKMPSDERLSLLDSMHIIPEYPDKPRYSDGVLEFGRLFMNKPGQDVVPQPRKLLDIRDNSKFSLYKSSPDSITCDPLTLTFPALPFEDSLTSSSGEAAESPSSSEKPPSVLSASSMTIYVTPMSSPNYDSTQQ